MRISVLVMLVAFAALLFGCPANDGGPCLCGRSMDSAGNVSCAEGLSESCRVMCACPVVPVSNTDSGRGDTAAPDAGCACNTSSACEVGCSCDTNCGGPVGVCGCSWSVGTCEQNCPCDPDCTDAGTGFNGGGSGG